MFAFCVTLVVLALVIGGVTVYHRSAFQRVMDALDTSSLKPTETTIAHAKPVRAFLFWLSTKVLLRRPLSVTNRIFYYAFHLLFLENKAEREEQWDVLMTKMKAMVEEAKKNA